jgi:hypothetical protein
MYIVKHKFMTVFEKILRHTLSTVPDRSEVGKLDAEVRAVYDALPEQLLARTMADSVVDPASLVVTRLCISFLYCKCLCVLHRPYVREGRQESIAVCYDAASGLVGAFLDAYHEFTPGGQVETESWFLSAISWHDFLFGIMALCLVLCAENRGASHPTIDRSASLALLEKARMLCTDQESKRHKDTTRVMELVGGVIAILGAEDGPQEILGYGPSLSSVTRIPLDVSVTKLHQFQDNMDWNATWDTGEYMTGLAQDPSWEYFEEFLNLNMVIQE